MPARKNGTKTYIRGVPRAGRSSVDRTVIKEHTRVGDSGAEEQAA